MNKGRYVTPSRCNVNPVSEWKLEKYNEIFFFPTLFTIQINS